MNGDLAKAVAARRNRTRCYATVSSGNRRCLQQRSPNTEFCHAHRNQPPTGVHVDQLLAQFYGMPIAKARRMLASEAGYEVQAEIQEQHKEDRSQVYFLLRGDLIKIGYSSDVARRMAALGHTTDDVIGTIPGGPHTERRLHRELQAYRVRGEWFQAHDKVLDVIQRELEADRHLIDAARS